jgi:hypothetical protein
MLIHFQSSSSFKAELDAIFFDWIDGETRTKNLLDEFGDQFKEAEEFLYQENIDLQSLQADLENCMETITDVDVRLEHVERIGSEIELYDEKMVKNHLKNMQKLVEELNVLEIPDFKKALELFVNESRTGRFFIKYFLLEIK